MIGGSCLCKAVQWRFDGMPDAATACNCTACRRYGRAVGVRLGR